MKSKEKVSELEEQYQEIFKGSPRAPDDSEDNLEQPYFGRIVQTVTTYSVSEKPELLG